MFLALLVVESAIVWVICGAALWLGDRPVRLMGAGCLLAWIATTLVHRPQEYINVQFGVAAVDIALLVFAVILALRYRRNWLVAASCFLMLTVTTHLAYMLDLNIVSRVRITASIIWSYLTLISLACGTWVCWRTRRRPAAEPPTRV